jgi:dTDP-4-dehydrorhamnose reductase
MRGISLLRLQNLEQVWELQVMKAMIIGATGLLGKPLMREWRGAELMGTGSRDLDIRDARAVRELIDRKHPDWIVLAAAYTDVDGCESNSELAFAVNREGAVNVASACKAAGAKLVFISSDYVFDGTKNVPYETGDQRNPQSVYGRTKAEAELRLLEILPDCCILRTSWLYGVGGKCFPDTILKLAATRPKLDVVNDQRGSPTYTLDLARAIVALCGNNAQGIVHASNAGNCTWFDFARAIVGDEASVIPVSSDAFPRLAMRPAYSVLSTERYERITGVKPESWEEGLREYLQRRP